MTETQKLLGFESPTFWSSAGIQPTAVEWPRVEGCAAMEIGGSGYRMIHSSQFVTPIAASPTRVGLSAFVPAGQPNPYWLGAIQLYVTCPSANVFNAYQGQVELTGRPQGRFAGIAFTLSSQAAALLSSSSGQCFWSIAVNANATPTPIVLDAMSFVAQ